MTPGPPPLEDDLEVVDGPTQVTPDHIPTADQQVPVATYVDWLPKDTQVVVCRIANDLYPGKRYESRDAALVDVRRVYGRILEANYVPGRAFFRVRKVRRFP